MSYLTVHNIKKVEVSKGVDPEIVDFEIRGRREEMTLITLFFDNKEDKDNFIKQVIENLKEEEA